MDRCLTPACKHLYEYAVISFGYTFLALICLLWSALAIGLYHLLPQRLGRRLGRLVIMRGFRLYVASLAMTRGFRFDLTALDALQHEEAMIIAPNHPSLLDAVMILSRLPDVACILKASLMDNILYGAGSRLARYIRNDSPKNMIRESVEDLRRGSHLLLFPEGTRTTRLPVNAFKAGLGSIAARAGAPIQTVFIETNSPFLGKGWRLTRRADMPIIYRIRLGRRFDAQTDVHALMEELEGYFEEQLNLQKSPLV